MLCAAGSEALFVRRQTDARPDAERRDEMIEKHYGDARVDAEQLDEMTGEFETSTGNPPGCA